MPETLLFLSSLTHMYRYLIFNPSTILFLHLCNHSLSSSPFSPLRSNFLLSLRSKALELINLHVVGFPPILSAVMAKSYFKNVSLTPSMTPVEYCKMQVRPQLPMAENAMQCPQTCVAHTVPTSSLCPTPLSLLWIGPKSRLFPFQNTFPGTFSFSSYFLLIQTFKRCFSCIWILSYFLK